MIETILDQVNAAVDRFVAKNQLLRNDRDDLVQDVFLKILPCINDNDFSLAQCRAFAHQATSWVCYTALRKYKANLKKRLHDKEVHHIDEVTSFQFWTVAEIMAGLLYDRIIDWDHVEKIVKENAALFDWYDIEKNVEISENLRKQIITKLEFVLQ